MTRPQPSEHAPYFSKYVDLVPDGDIATTLATQTATLTAFWHGITEGQSLQHPPGKWNIKQVLNHIIDAERIFAYRALRIGRADPTPLPGFEQDDYEAHSHATARSWNSLLEEYSAVRRASQTLLAGLPADAWPRQGTASNHAITTKAAAFVIAGHELHHVALLRANYL